MRQNETPAPAASPEDLGRFFLERAGAGDVEGVVALYQRDAVLAISPDQVAAGHEAIRQFYSRLLASRPVFAAADQQPALCSGDLALTSTRLPSGGVTVEVARRQADGTWLWVIDQPSILG